MAAASASAIILDLLYRGAQFPGGGARV